MKNFIKVLPIIVAVLSVGSFIISVLSDGYVVTPTDTLIIAVLNVLVYGFGNSKNE
jgi:hypothetical protein